MSIKYKISRMMFEKFRHVQHHPSGLIKQPSFNWVQTESKLPWLKLQLDIPTDIIKSEIQAIKNLLVPHRDDYSEHRGWESFCIHGHGYNLTREDNHYTNVSGYHWTKEACEYMPETVKYFQTQWPGAKFQRVRVMRLAPGGYIAIHSDGPPDWLGPINIAITQPKDCYFVMEKFGIVPFDTGSAFWLNVSTRHAVFNDSDQERWHIIVHQQNDNIEFHNIVAKSYDMLYNQFNERMSNNNQG